MARNAVGAAEELLRHQPGQLVEKVRIMKTQVCWVVLFISILCFPWNTRFGWLSAILLALLGVWTAKARWDARKTLRGAYIAWQETNNERHRALALVERMEQARTAALEQLDVERELTFDATCKLMLLKEFTDAFVTPETIREGLQKLAVEFKEYCEIQQRFYATIGVHLHLRHDSSLSDVEAKLNTTASEFADLKIREAAIRQQVEAAKQSFWKQHDLVGKLIELGLLSPECSVLEGKSFTKYLPSEQSELQALGVHAEGANEQPGQ